MPSPQFDQIADALVGILRAADGFCAPQDISNVSGDIPVFDGPTPSGEDIYQFVCVGWDGTDDPDTPAGEFAVEWAGMGNAAQMEEIGTITGTIVIGGGDEDFSDDDDENPEGYPDLRTTASTTLGYLVDAVRDDPALGLTGVVEFSTFKGGSFRQGVSAAGAFVKVDWTVEYLARI